jgi:hypothetical protein
VRSYKASVRRILLALVLSVALAGCGGGGGTAPSAPKPSLRTLFTRAASAASSKHSAHYVLDVTVSVETSNPVQNALVQAFFANPIKLHLEGDASAKAFSADGSVSISGRDFSGKLLAGPDELYAELLGTWYGTKQSGIGSLTQLGRSRLNNVPGAQQTSGRQLREHAEEILSGTTSDGPTLEGANTWEFEGTLDSSGLARLSSQNGQALTARQQDALRALQDATELTIDIGKEDHLLRKFELTLGLGRDGLKKLGPLSSTSLHGISALHASLGLELGKWGEAVAITPPESYKPVTNLTSYLGLGVALILRPSTREGRRHVRRREDRHADRLVARELCQSGGCGRAGGGQDAARDQRGPGRLDERGGRERPHHPVPNDRQHRLRSRALRFLTFPRGEGVASAPWSRKPRRCFRSGASRASPG